MTPFLRIFVCILVIFNLVGCYANRSDQTVLQSSTDRPSPTPPERQPNPVAVKVIADDLDSLVGDTVDEGSWDANVIRDSNGNPTETLCKVEAAGVDDTYICTITFLCIPYDRDDVDSDPWKSTCESVRYLVKTKADGKVVVEGNQSDTTACLETLNEGP
jgi:hypothetical protein